MLFKVKQLVPKWLQRIINGIEMVSTQFPNKGPYDVDPCGPDVDPLSNEFLNKVPSNVDPCGPDVDPLSAEFPNNNPSNVDPTHHLAFIIIKGK